MLHSKHTQQGYGGLCWLVVSGMQPTSGGFLMKPDIGAIADVLSDIIELMDVLRNDVLLMMEDLE